MTTSGSATLRMSLRPPRVAVIFDGGSQWHYWARRALHACTNIWGGAGFIVVPHSSGKVHPQMLDAVRAYDPDYVVTLQRTIRSVELAAPGALTINGADGRPLSPERRVQLIETQGDNEIEHPDDEVARLQVVSACSSHRRATRTGSDGWDEDVTSISVGGAASRLTSVAAVAGSYQGPCLSAPPEWGGLVGAAVASSCGAVIEPELGLDPALSDEDLRQLILWLIAAETRIGRPPYELIWHPTVAMSTDPATQPIAFSRTTQGLLTVAQGIRSRPKALVVIGDAAEDFALAHAYRTLYGSGTWLPSSWLALNPGGSTILFAVKSVIASYVYRGGGATIATTSMLETEISSVVAELRQPVSWAEGDEVNTQGRHRERITVGPITWTDNGIQHLAIDDQFDMDFVIPVVRHDNDDIEMSARCPAPTVTQPELGAGAGSALHWQVDVDIAEATTPRGRGLGGSSFLSDGEDEYQTWIRDSRNGITFESERYNFIPAGTPAKGRLARPRFRAPGLLNWTNLIAQQTGHGVRLSAAGRRVAILQRLVGGREALAALISGPLLPVLRAFTPFAKKEQHRFAHDEGVTLSTGTGTNSLEGYLTFEGMAQRLDPADIPQLRNKVDELLIVGLLRRGLVIGCQQCRLPSFTAIDSIAQRNSCPRCSAVNDLVQASWREPADEPRWYYDLHTLMRQHLLQNGDIPLQLAHYLRPRHRQYTDIAEIELCNGKGDAVAESDLIALADGRIISAEVKRPGTLGEGKELKSAIKKRLDLADHLLADQVLLATADVMWDHRTIEALRSGITGYRWRRSTPVARLISALGSGPPVDLQLNLADGTTPAWK